MKEYCVLLIRELTHCLQSVFATKIHSARDLLKIQEPLRECFWIPPGTYALSILPELNETRSFGQDATMISAIF